MTPLAANGGFVVPRKTGSTFKRDQHQIESTADHADVAERLGVVAKVCVGRWIDLFGEEGERAGPRAEAIVEFERFVEAALKCEVIHQPETAQQECAFVSRQSIGRDGWLV